jgi:NADH dehydrogenase
MDAQSATQAIAGAWAVVNAVSLYVEHGQTTFDAVHVRAAERIASLAQRHGVERLVHVSGIGVDQHSPSPYIRSRAHGEQAVRAQFPNAILIRPSVMFGPGDVFLTQILKLLRRLPVYPLFGRGQTLLQPTYVEDVAEAVSTLLRAANGAMTVECGGPHTYSYEALLRMIARRTGLRTTLVPVPFPLWHALAYLAEMLPHPPLTRNQVELMQVDSTVSEQGQGFGHLGMTPRSIEEILPFMS